MSAKESFLNLANSVEKGKLDIINMGPTNLDSEGNMQITFDFKKKPKTIKQPGKYKTNHYLIDAIISHIDSHGNGSGRVVHGDKTESAIWNKYGENLYPGDSNKEFDLKLR